MKSFFLLGLLLFSQLIFAQVQDVVSGSHTPGFHSYKNFIKNTSCLANTRNITTSGSGAITRTTTAPLEPSASCQIAGTSSGDKVIFGTKTFDNSLKLQNCELRFTYSGDGSKWKVYAQTNSIASSTELALVSTYNDQLAEYLPKEVSIPFVCGDLSNSTAPVFEATASTPGNLKVAKVYIGALTSLSKSDESRIAGESYFAGTSNCQWSRTSTTVGAFTADSDCPGPTVVFGDMGSWQTTDSDLPRQTINNLPAGKYKATFIFASSVSGGAYTSFGINDGSTTCEPVLGGVGTVQTSSMVSCIFNYSTSGNRIFELYSGTQSTITVSVYNASTAPRNSTKFILEYFGSSSTLSAQNSDTDWASCGHTTSDFTGFGTVTNIETQCKRQGGDLLMKGKFTSGTPTATEARLALKFNNQNLTSKGTSVIPSIQKAGDGGRSTHASTEYGVVLIEPSVSYVTFGLSNGAVAILSKQSGTAFIAAGNVYTLEARIPINGWDNSNVIQATLKDGVYSIGSTNSQGKPTDFQMVLFGTGTNCATVCTTGTCSICSQVGGKITSISHAGAGNGVYNVNGIDGTKYTCFGNSYDGTAGGIMPILYSKSSSTSTYARITTGIGSNNYNSWGTIFCIGTP